MPDQDNPYAAPKSNLERLNQQVSEQVDASRWQRLGAALIDILLQIVASFILTLSIMLLFWSVGWGNRFSLFNMTPYAWVDHVLSIIISLLLYLAINWGDMKVGQTRGKRILGIRLVMLDGQPASVRTNFWRMAVFGGVGALPYIGWLISLIDGLRIFAADRRCVHDLVFGTRVIKV